MAVSEVIPQCLFIKYENLLVKQNFFFQESCNFCRINRSVWNVHKTEFLNDEKASQRAENINPLTLGNCFSSYLQGYKVKFCSACIVSFTRPS